MNRIVVEVIGGLGNQLFQYAFGRAVSIRRDATLIIDISAFDNYTLRHFNLNHLNIEGEIQKFNGECSLPIYTEPHFHFDETVFRHEQSTRYRGYWQSPAYFSSFSDRIRQELQLIQPLNSEYRDALMFIKSDNSVGIHIRRGDYASNTATKAFHGLATNIFFDSAIKLMRKRLRNPHFLVFSDDIPWCRANFRDSDIDFLDIPAQDGDHGLKACRDLHLLSKCHHKILSNSSFSWWSAWLEHQQDQIIIAPHPWFAAPGLDTRDLIDPNWERMPIG